MDKVLKEADNSEGDGAGATDAQTGAVAKEPKKRGRPKGSKNKVSADARALLAVHGLPGIRMLCRVAAGHAITRRDAAGGREKLVPDLDQMLAAQKLLLDRLVPSLAAVQLSGDPESPLFPEETDTRDLARAVLDVLRQAHVESEADDEDEPAPMPLLAAPGAPEMPSDMDGGGEGLGHVPAPSSSPASRFAPHVHTPREIEFPDRPAQSETRRWAPNKRAYIVERGDRWAVCNDEHQVCAYARGRAQAEKWCLELDSTGQISRGPA